MCGRTSVAHRPGLGSWERPGKSGDFFGIDVEKMDPKARVTAALVVLAPVALSGFFLIAFVPGLWWIFTTYGWVSFPAFGLLLRGLASQGNRKAMRAPAGDSERELLIALREHGELTPVRAATETSLSVAEADRMLKELAGDGHLEVRARGGGLFYALWGKEGTR
ncbi:MAG: hypothetical protein LC781_03835 [Actinobacteria bacterium]|nr:hypothetical protein [Actinomycetota bacterium]